MIEEIHDTNGLGHCFHDSREGTMYYPIGQTST